MGLFALRFCSSASFICWTATLKKNILDARQCHRFVWCVGQRYILDGLLSWWWVREDYTSKGCSWKVVGQYDHCHRGMDVGIRKIHGILRQVLLDGVLLSQSPLRWTPSIVALVQWVSHCCRRLCCLLPCPQLWTFQVVLQLFCMGGCEE